MRNKKILGATAAIAVGALMLGGCTPQASTPNANTPAPRVNTDTSVNVMWNQPFYSYNRNSNTGNATANSNIWYLTNDSVTYYAGKDLKVTTNTDFGKYEKVSDNPLKVKVTLTDKAKWSDGTPVTAEDLILNWVALSAHFNTMTDEEANSMRSEDGSTIKNAPAGKVFFDAVSPSMQLVTDMPEVGDNGKSVTYTYSVPYADWEKTIWSSELPLHIIMKKATGEADAAKAKAAFMTALKSKDAAVLGKVADVWNSAFNFDSMPSDKDVLVTTGAYQISDFKKDEYLTVTANPNYAGSHKPNINKVTIRYNEQATAAVQALANGEVQLISPQSTADVLAALKQQTDINLQTGVEGTYEHVDLTYNNGGPFDPKTYGGDANKAKLVRQAFLQTIPRQKIIDTIIKPLNPDAQIRNSYNTIPGTPEYADVVKANGMEAQYGGGDNTDKAKALLQQAGVTGPSVRILYAKNNSRRVQEFQLMKEAAEKAGFKIVDNGNDKWGSKLGDKTYDASFFGWQSTGTGVTEAKANYVTGGTNNKGGIVNARIDELYKELDTATDPARQKAINEEVEKILVDDAFGITIFQFPSVTASKKTLQGVDPITISPTIFWNYWEWKVS